MKPRFTIILAVMVVVSGMAFAQTAPGAGTEPAPSAAVRILSPHAGDKLNQSFVTVQYQLENPGVAGGSPNFSIQLDGRDPVVTTQTEQNFTGLGPGSHTIVVQLVDANNTPLTGSRVQQSFTIVSPANPPSATPQPQAKNALPQSDQVAATDAGTEALPSASSALPLLSVVGFGALVGGIASALRTR